MNSMISIFLTSNGIDPFYVKAGILAVLLLMILILLIMQIRLSGKFKKLNRTYERFMCGKDMESMEQTVLAQFDRIEELEPGKRAVGRKAVTYNEPFFAGHFPQEPVMPGVLICEALAQTGAVALLSCEAYKGKLAFFGGINKARFRRKVVPGDVLRLETELLKIKGLVGVAKATAYVDGEVCTEAELTFVVQ